MRSVHDAEGNYVEARWSQELFGWSEDDLRGTNAYAYFHPDDVDAIASSHDGVLALGQELQVWYRIKCKDGAWKWVESRSHLEGDQIVVITEAWHGTKSASARVVTLESS